MAQLKFPLPTQLQNLLPPTDGSDAATKDYVDGFSGGATGATGDIGPSGATGFNGSRGYTGSLGYTGSRGETGYWGSTGASGIPGATGPNGYTGSQGIPGEFAGMGYTGSAGAGYTGSAGPSFGDSENQVIVSNLLPSVSTTTGALVVAGGVGVGGDIFAGSFNSDGNVYLGGLTLSNIGITVSSELVNQTTGSANNYSSYFNGTSNHLNFNNSRFLSFGTGDFTIEFWCKLPQQSDSYIIDGRPATSSLYLILGGDKTGTPKGTLNYAYDDTCSSKRIDDNLWHHCAITRKDSEVTIWIDGVSSAKTVDESDYNYEFGYWVIGAQVNQTVNPPTYNNYLRGYLNNLRIVKGSALYTTTFAPSKEPLNPVDGTSILTCQTQDINDNSGNNVTIRKFGNFFTTNLEVPKVIPVPSITWIYDKDGNWTSNNGILINANTISTNTTTGALITRGGVGVSGDVNIGGNIKINGSSLFSGNTTVGGNLFVTNGNVVTKKLQADQVYTDNLFYSNGAPYTVASENGGYAYTGSRGIPGEYAAVGFTGSLGFAGSQGIQGIPGEYAAVGFTGSRGDTGFTGSFGFSGSVGFTGSRGYAGSHGYFGSVGFTGSLGFTGSQGIQGIPGEYAAVGFTGSRGDTGFTGSIGHTGSRGYTGSVGYTGSRGLSLRILGSVNSFQDLPQLINGTILWKNNPDKPVLAGDMAFNNETGNLLLWTGTFWEDQGSIIGPSGPIGESGYTGSQGDLGPTGVEGPPGYTGSEGTGYTGSEGPSGLRGPTGYAGSRGFTGSQGTGFTGSQGVIGPSGGIGLVGATGPLGYTGSRGAYDAVGFTGSQGETGFTGSFGFTGSLGYAGSRGYTGSFGFTGSIGFTGSAGFTGSVGYTGTMGYTGSIGFTGSVGFTGSRGIPGEYAAIGFTGSKGDIGGIGFTGSRGIPGEYAAIGFTGSQGDTGFTGSLGYSGSIGFTGSQGLDGAAVDKGYTGSQGIIGLTGFTGSAGGGSGTGNVTTVDPAFTGNGTINGYALGTKVLPQTVKPSNYVLTLDDNGGQVLHPRNDAYTRTWVVPSDDQVNFPIGSTVTLINQTGAGNVLVSFIDSVYFGGSSVQSVTLVGGGFATAFKIANKEWVIQGVGIGGELFAGPEGYTGSAGSFSSTNSITISSDQESTSTITGALIVNGGVGIGKSINIGGNANVGGNLIANGNFVSSTVSTGDITSSGNLLVSGFSNITGDLSVAGNLSVQRNTRISRNLSVAGSQTITAIYDSTSTNSGALVVSGGVGIAGNTFIGGITQITGNTSIFSTVDSNSTDTGALIVSGGIGVAKAMNLGGNITIGKTTTSNIGSQISNIGVSVEVQTYSVLFNAARLQITDSTLASFATSTTQITVEAWAYLTSSGGAIIQCNVGSVYSLELSFSGLYPMFGNNGGGTWQRLTSSTAITLDSWNHIAAVFTGSTCKIFVNGILTGTGGASSWTTVAATTVLIGTNINGYIRNLRLVKGYTLYSQNFVPTTSQIFAVSGTQLLTCNDSNIVDNSPNNYTIAIVGSATISNFSNQKGSNQLFAMGDAWNTLSNFSAQAILADGYFYANGEAFTGGGVKFPTSQLIITTNTTPSTSTITGALQVAGGAGIGGNVYIGGSVNVPYGTSASAGINFAANPGGGGGDFASLKYYAVSGENTRFEIAVGNDAPDEIYLTSPGATVINSNTESSSTSTGALKVLGGAGVAGSLYVGNLLTASAGNGSRNGIAFTPNPGGGAGDYATLRYYSVSGDTTRLEISVSNDPDDTLYLTCSGPTVVSSDTNSSSTITGAFQVFGGAGIAKNLYVGGDVVLSGGFFYPNGSAYTGGSGTVSFPTTQAIVTSNVSSATSTTTGALQVAGGAGIGGSMFLGGQLNVLSTISSTSTTTGAVKISGGAGIAGNVFAGAVYSDNIFYSNGTRFSSGISSWTVPSGNLLIVSNTQASTSTTTGAVTVAGGIGVAGNVFAGAIYSNNIFYSNGQPISSVTTSDPAFTGNATINGYEIGTKILPQNSISTDYTLILSDGGKQLFHPKSDSANRTWTVPSNATVAYPIGTALTFINQSGAGNVSVVFNDTVVFGGQTQTGPILLVPGAVASAFKIALTEWNIQGVGIGGDLYVGPPGYTGSQGNIGYVGSASTIIGYTGSIGGTVDPAFTGNGTINGFEIGTKIIPQTIKSDNYTTALTDSGCQIFHPETDKTVRTWAIPTNTSVAYPIGTVLTFINHPTGANVTITCSDTVYYSGNSQATGNRILSSGGVATAIKITQTEWLISGTNLY